MEVLYQQESYNLIGALMTVHRELGCGFLESVYQEAFEKELQLRHIPFEREKEFEIYYKGHKLTKKFVSDFVCYDKIIVELKSVERLNEAHYAQTLNYMKITGYKLGLLVNFAKPKLEYQRIVRQQGW
jgi:GxxExxY protein